MFEFIHLDLLKSVFDRPAQFPLYAATLVFGYLLGSIPFGLLFAHLAGAGDVRKIGSGNIGATNVLRTGKRWAAAATLLCDAGKGAAAALLAKSHGYDAMLFAGLGAFLGHLFPVWLGFRGGKGVATFFGVTLAFDWQVGLIALATWLVVAFVSRISSLSALVAATMTLICFMLLHNGFAFVFEIVLAVMIFFMHRENIRRILSGTEPRIGASSAPSHPR